MFPRFGVPESAFAKHKWATTWYDDRVSTSQTLYHARKTFLLNTNIQIYPSFTYLKPPMTCKLHKTRKIYERPMYKETYPNVSSKSNEKHRSFRSSSG